MKIFSFQGYSDDTVVTEISNGTSVEIDEHDVYGLRKSHSPLSGRWEIRSESEGHVFVDALWWTGWGFSVMADAEEAEDGAAATRWPVRVELGEKAYSYKLSIDASDDAVLNGPLPSYGEG